MMDSESTTAMEAEAPRPLSGAWLEDNPRAATLLTFVAGLLLGWWVLGWWLFPVSWSEAQPYHLRQDLRADWVQLVANDYQGNGQLDKAAERLASMDAATLITEFEALQADEARTANEHANVRQLSENLRAGGVLDAAAEAGSSGVPADVAAAPAAPAADAAAAAVSAQDLLRILALAVAVGALAGLVFLAGSMVLARTRDAAARRLGASLPGSRGLTAPNVSLPGLGDDLRPSSGGAPGAGGAAPMRFDPLARTQGMPAIPSQATAALPALGGAVSRAAPSRQAPAWRPNRIEIDQTVDARYLEGDTQSILTWLVYGSRGALVGGAGLLAQPIGGVNTIDLWFADRDDVDQTRKTPTVTFITTQAYQDPVLRARLADRRLMPATPGRRLRLETAELWLDIEVIDAEPQDGAAHPSLRGLVLALTPHQRLDVVTPRPQAEISADDDGGWEAALDEEIDDAFEPPRPLQFRRD
ncbi:MAG: hypothetical protein IPJ58_07065 [Ardenticatenia bacterium]|nr:hypothetical protein [Ardenticatenia bacterium]